MGNGPPANTAGPVREAATQATRLVPLRVTSRVAWGRGAERRRRRASGSHRRRPPGVGEKKKHLGPPAGPDQGASRALGSSRRMRPGVEEMKRLAAPQGGPGPNRACAPLPRGVPGSRWEVVCGVPSVAVPPIPREAAPGAVGKRTLSLKVASTYVLA